MKILLIALFLILPLQAFAFCDDWRTQDTVLEASFQILTVIDWGQTLNFTQHSDREESNPVLGKHPSRDRVNEYIPLGMAAHAAISCLLPPRWREPWQAFSLLLEFNAVAHNTQMGIGINF